MADIAPREAYGRVFGFHRALDTLGAIIGPLLVVLFLQRKGHQWILLASLIPGILSVLTFAVFVRDRPMKDSRERRFLETIRRFRGPSEAS